MKNVYELIEANEDDRLHMYDDATGKPIHGIKDIKGNPTIGKGHNLFARPISKAASDMILHDDVNAVLVDLAASIPFFSSLDEVRAAVLIDMCYNMGIYKLLKFQKMLNAMANKEWDLAADEARDSAWSSQTDPGGDRVWARPDRIEHMLRTGTWPDK